MFSIKRSAATLGVVAGLLAAAAPASAQIMPGMVGVKAPTDPAGGFIAPIGSDKGSLKAAGTETGNPERSGPALASSRAGAFALELEGKIVGAKAPVPASCLVDFASGVCYFHTLKAPASPTSMVFTSVSNVTTAAGTQIGFED